MDRPRGTRTTSFGTSRRESHDASSFYERFTAPTLSDDTTVNRPAELLDTLGDGRAFVGSSTDMAHLPDNSVALVVTSPPYFVGKDYEVAVTGDEGAIPSTYVEFLELLRDVFAECTRVLEPGGRIAVNVANLGRKPYRSLASDVITILQDDLGLLLRGEVIWQKAEAAGGSCAWGSFAKASNPVLRDNTERVIIASKGAFQRALPPKKRAAAGLPHVSTITNDEFIAVTNDVWDMPPESATRIGHPAPFPVELPRRLIDLYTYVGDLVLDPFLGSGTTLVAAARTGRIGVGYDLDPDYVALSEERLADERARIGRLEAATTDGDDTTTDELGHDERQDLAQARAVDAGKRANDLAAALLERAGFELRKGPKVKGAGIEFSFLATDADGGEWWVDLAGTFTTSRPGLQRPDTLWRLLGRVQVLRGKHPGAKVLAVTTTAPKPGSPTDQSLRAAGPGAVFDVIELFDDAATERLRSYAAGGVTAPLPGFWPAA